MIKIVKTTMLVLLNTVVLLILFEISAAVFFIRNPRPDVVYQYSYLTGYKYDAYIGFTSPMFPFYGSPKTAKPAVVITGGSTAAGVGVVDPQFSYYRVLERNLISAKLIGPNQMFNFAVPGYVSNQESATYKFHIFNLPHPPKVVISFTGFNDLYFYLFRTMDVGDHEFGFAMDYIFRKGYPSASQLSERLRNFMRSTRMYGLFHYFSHPHRSDSSVEPIRLSSDLKVPYQPTREEPTEEKIQIAAKNFLDNCLSTSLLARSKGTTFVVLLQPNYYYGGTLTVQENEWFHTVPDLENWINSVKLHQISYDKFYNLVLNGLKGYKKQGLLDYLDYRALLKDAGPVYLDPVHFNVKGSKMVAEKMELDLKGFFKN